MIKMPLNSLGLILPSLQPQLEVGFFMQWKGSVGASRLLGSRLSTGTRREGDGTWREGMVAVMRGGHVQAVGGGNGDAPSP